VVLGDGYGPGITPAVDEKPRSGRACVDDDAEASVGKPLVDDGRRRHASRGLDGMREGGRTIDESSSIALYSAELHCIHCSHCCRYCIQTHTNNSIQQTHASLAASSPPPSPFASSPQHTSLRPTLACSSTSALASLDRSPKIYALLQYSVQHPHSSASVRFSSLPRPRPAP
jgi:hypothetical protein